MTIHRTRLTRSAIAPRAVRSRQESPSIPSQPRRRASLGARLLTRLVADRGDVPGWVMITLMTAAIVVALWAIASEQFVAIFNNALRPFLGEEL